MVKINTDDYEFVCLPYENPTECKVYRKFHLDKTVGRVVMRLDGTFDEYDQLSPVLLRKALEYLGYYEKDAENV